ncbi:hypothetical protein, partial [Flavonifractor plautii]|uniref:hypothetical protein n=1 Tax=Flavonifractor plautii TaxID=292800 RepID=UPI001D06C2EE
KERLSHLQIFLNLVNGALSPIRTCGGWGPDLILPRRKQIPPGQGLLRKTLARRTCGAGKERLSHLQIFLNLVNDALSPIRASGGWGPDLILPRRK